MGKESPTESIQPKAKKGLLDRFFKKDTIAAKKETANEKGNVITRALKNLFKKTEKNQVKEEIRKAIVDIKNETLPKRPYDLAGAIEHFNKLKPEVKEELQKAFEGKWVNLAKGNFDLLDAVYQFQKDNGLEKDGIAGKATRSKIAEISNGKYFNTLYLEPEETNKVARSILE